ncbi:hypothetical protein, partial [Amycolatopsis vancoresmycina]
MALRVEQQLAEHERGRVLGVAEDRGVAELAVVPADAPAVLDLLDAPPVFGGFAQLVAAFGHVELVQLGL